MRTQIKLTKDGFWVNGKKQSATVEQKYRAIYKVKTGQAAKTFYGILLSKSNLPKHK